MNKTDLSKALSLKTGMTKKAAGETLDSLLEVIVDEVSKGTKVQLSGFGTFEAKTRKARTARNPKTRDIVNVPETKVPVFKPGAAFKSVIK